MLVGACSNGGDHYVAGSRIHQVSFQCKNVPLLNSWTTEFPPFNIMYLIYGLTSVFGREIAFFFFLCEYFFSQMRIDHFPLLSSSPKAIPKSPVLATHSLSPKTSSLYIHSLCLLFCENRIWNICFSMNTFCGGF